MADTDSSKLPDSGVQCLRYGTKPGPETKTFSSTRTTIFQVIESKSALIIGKVFIISDNPLFMIKTERITDRIKDVFYLPPPPSNW